MKSLIVSVTTIALMLMVSSAQVQAAIDSFFDISVSVQIDTPDGQGSASIASIPSPNNVVTVDGNQTSVQYLARIVDSTIPELDPGIGPFTVSGNGTIQPNTAGGPPLLVDIALNSPVGGQFNLLLGGDFSSGGPDFSLFPAGQGQLVQPTNFPAPVIFRSHRITPEPGSMVLLGLGAAAVMGTRRRKAA